MPPTRGGAPKPHLQLPRAARPRPPPNTSRPGNHLPSPTLATTQPRTPPTTTSRRPPRPSSPMALTQPPSIASATARPPPLTATAGLGGPGPAHSVAPPRSPLRPRPATPASRALRCHPEATRLSSRRPPTGSGCPRTSLLLTAGGRPSLFIVSSLASDWIQFTGGFCTLMPIQGRCRCGSTPASTTKVVTVAVQLTSSIWVVFRVQTVAHFIHKRLEQRERAGAPSLQLSDRTRAVHKTRPRS